MAIGAGLGAGSAFMNWDVVGSTLSDAGRWAGGLFSGIEWQPFYKIDLVKYVVGKGINPSEKNLGDEFENIFEKHAKEELYPKDALQHSRFRRAEKIWTDASDRNSKPDFISDDFYDVNQVFWLPEMKRVSEGSGWEIKQNNGRGIYLSSNDGQIRGIY